MDGGSGFLDLSAMSSTSTAIGDSSQIEGKTTNALLARMYIN